MAGERWRSRPRARAARARGRSSRGLRDRAWPDLGVREERGVGLRSAKGLLHGLHGVVRGVGGQAADRGRKQGRGLVRLRSTGAQRGLRDRRGRELGLGLGVAEVLIERKKREMGYGLNKEERGRGMAAPAKRKREMLGI